MTATRRDAAQHGSRRMLQLGCDCFPCRLADSRYKQLWREGQGARRPVQVVLRHLANLEASGWTRLEIRGAAGLGTSTLWHITSGRQKSVNSRTAAAILSLQPHEVTIDLTDLAREVGRRHHVGHFEVLSRTDRPAPVAARHELTWLLRAAGWSCAAAGEALHRSASWVSVSSRRVAPDDELNALVDLAPDPPDTGCEVREDVVDDPGCEDCGAEPMGGGRWCYPCYLDHRGQAVAA